MASCFVGYVHLVGYLGDRKVVNGLVSTEVESLHRSWLNKLYESGSQVKNDMPDELNIYLGLPRAQQDGWRSGAIPTPGMASVPATDLCARSSAATWLGNNQSLLLYQVPSLEKDHSMIRNSKQTPLQGQKMPPPCAPSVDAQTDGSS